MNLNEFLGTIAGLGKKTNHFTTPRKLYKGALKNYKTALLKNNPEQRKIAFEQLRQLKIK